MNQQDIKVWAQNYNAKLLCTDKMFKNCVSVRASHPDSYMFYNSAFAIIKINAPIMQIHIPLPAPVPKNGTSMLKIIKQPDKTSVVLPIKLTPHAIFVETA